MRFDKVIILGSGKIACDVVTYLNGILEKNILYVLEILSNPLSSLSKISNKYGISYSNNCKENDIEQFIDNIGGAQKLIISANNQHIFSGVFLAHKNIEVINFHYSYLPEYRGMNIPTWVIYNNEDYTGVTWHYVTQNIDSGDIISQKRIKINDDSTAFELTYLGMKLGIELFKSFIIDLLNFPIAGDRIYRRGKLYLQHMVPDNGYLDVRLPIEDIYKLLRCFDYVTDKLNELGLTKDELVLSGASMGTFGSLYYGSKLSPHALLLAKPLANMGNVARNERILRAGGFATSLDILMKNYDNLSDEAIEQLNNRMWDRFDSADWSQTKFIISYLYEDDYDPDGYPSILSHLKSSGVEVYGKGSHGRHTDNSANVMAWFKSQYNNLLHDDFSR